VVTIADEVDSQLKEAMTCYIMPSTVESGPVRLAG
jgi:hypothetical protein